MSVTYEQLHAGRGGVKFTEFAFYVDLTDEKRKKEKKRIKNKTK